MEGRLRLCYRIIAFSCCEAASRDGEGEKQMCLEDKQKKLHKSLNDSAGAANLLGELQSQEPFSDAFVRTRGSTQMHVNAFEGTWGNAWTPTATACFFRKVK